MPRKIKITPWKFPESEPVVCRWICSPKRVSGNHSRISVVFRRPNGYFESVEMAWGIARLLKIGGTYVNGELTSDKPLGEIYTISAKLKPLGSNRASKLIPRNIYAIGSPQALSEWCWILRFPEGRLIMPKLLLLTKVIAPFAVLLRALPKPKFLNSEVVHDLDEDNRVLHLRFNPKIPLVAVKQDEFLLTVARIFHDPTFSTAWNQVHAQYEKALAQKEAFPEVNFDFPDFAPQMKLRCIVEYGLYVVLDIINVTPNYALPFDKIVYSHPGLKASTKEPTSGPKKETITPRAYFLDNTPIPVNVQGSVSLLSSPDLTPALQNPQQIELVAAVEGQITTNHPRSDIESVMKGPAANVSVAEEQYQGTARGAEYNPTPPKPPVERPDRLEAFWGAKKYIEDKNPDLRISHSFFEIRRNIKFRTDLQPPRGCVILSIKWPDGKRCWVLEFERIKGDTATGSTLFFLPKSDMSVENTVEKLLAVALRSSGSWSRDKVKKEVGAAVYLYHKGNESAEKWGQRIYDSAVELAFQRSKK